MSSGGAAHVSAGWRLLPTSVRVWQLPLTLQKKLVALSLVAQLVKNPRAVSETAVRPWSREVALEKGSPVPPLNAPLAHGQQGRVGE